MIQNQAVLPKGWKFVFLDSLGTFLRGTGIAKSDLAEDGLPCIRYGEIYTTHHFSIEQFYSFIDKESARKSRRIYAGDLLFAGSGETLEEIGKCVAYTGEEIAYAGGDIIILRLSNGDAKYLGFLLNHDIVNQQKYRLGQGHSVVHIYPNQLANIQIPLPPLGEAEKIAKMLSTWDEAIKLVEKMTVAKEQFKKGLTQHLLTGQIRLPSFGKAKSSFVTKFGTLPVEWEVAALGELVEPISRIEKVSANKVYKLVGVKWYVSGAHIHDTLPGESIRTTALSRIETGDVLYNKMWASKAAFAIAKTEHHGAFSTTEYPQFKANKHINVQFLEYVFQLARFQYDATALCRGTTGRARLNPNDFLKLEIPLPSLNEQQCIVDVLCAIDREIELLKQKLAALQAQKKGLMQQLLTGQLRVKVDPDFGSSLKHWVLLTLDSYVPRKYNHPTRTEAQKLLYFVQTHFGVPLGLEFEEGKYGPYSKELDKQLISMNGKEIFGYKKGERKQIKLNSRFLHQAQAALLDQPEAQALPEKFAEFLRGFENPKRLEILATVHWVMRKTPSDSIENIVNKVHEWNTRKSKFTFEQIAEAYSHLRQFGV